MQKVPGDRIYYPTPESAAIALSKLVRIIDQGDKAKADLFDGGGDAQPKHLIEPHADLIDDLNQEVQSPQLVGVSRKRSKPQPNKRENAHTTVVRTPVPYLAIAF